jgi:hypothetical protein
MIDNQTQSKQQVRKKENCKSKHKQDDSFDKANSLTRGA